MTPERELICADIKPHACCDCERCRRFMADMDRTADAIEERIAVGFLRSERDEARRDQNYALAAALERVLARWERS